MLIQKIYLKQYLHLVCSLFFVFVLHSVHFVFQLKLQVYLIHIAFVILLSFLFFDIDCYNFYSLRYFGCPFIVFQQIKFCPLHCSLNGKDFIELKLVIPKNFSIISS